MKVQIAFDINLELIGIESIFNKYVKDDETFIFTSGKRYPVIDKSKIDKNEMISREPFMVYKCVPCVVLLLLRKVYEITWDEKDLFEYNPLMDHGENYIEKYSLSESSENVIEMFIPTISNKDKYKIIAEVNNIFGTSGIFRHIATYKDHVFEIDHEDKVFLLNVIGHIKELRYQELLDNTTEGEEEWTRR